MVRHVGRKLRHNIYFHLSIVAHFKNNLKNGTLAGNLEILFIFHLSIATRATRERAG